MNGIRVEIRGIVQGVGFRPWVYRLAQASGVNGHVRNDSSGVTIEVFGNPDSLGKFLVQLESSPPPAAKIHEIRREAIPYKDVAGFFIAPSAEAGDRAISIPPDLATCPDCVAEIFDPADRRFRYPFTNCTNCGPRFTIARDVPYDRPATTMAPFVMCADCRREYETVEDRRFHAQPNACPVCGPRLTAVRAAGEAVTGDVIELAARALREGEIVAVKGIGGFHLACDATSERAVQRLRDRKRRDEKPFAVMVRTIEEALRLAHVTDAERKLLESIERPIVLLRRRERCELAANVAPGNRLVGLMLAYSPLHHLLLADCGRPLIMTSGNLSEEPIAYRNDDATERLGAIADLFLLHDREIETRCDDSIARVIEGAPVVLRRSRGYVPRALPAQPAFETTVLACGAHLKNTFAIGDKDRLFLGPHIGDLENVSTLESYEQSIERMLRFVKVTPGIVAYDLHPGYLSTEYALRRGETTKIGVQHHHAHVAAVMGEHHVDGPVIGLAWDGTGYGTDGAAWGGEVLVADYAGFERVATFRPIRLAGGDAAIRNVWRVALSLVDDAFDGAPPLDLPLFEKVPAAELQTVRAMLRSGFNVARAHGVGRYFDAVGAIALARPKSRYEGQVAFEWNLAASDIVTAPYRFDLDTDATPWEIDLRPAVRAIVADLATGVSVARVSAAFHETLAAAAEAVVREIARSRGELPVAYAGGCFQNALLVERTRARLRDFTLLCSREVPPGDGGIAYGQALVAAAVARAR